MYKIPVVLTSEEHYLESNSHAVRPLCGVNQSKPKGGERRFTFDPS